MNRKYNKLLLLIGIILLVRIGYSQNADQKEELRNLFQTSSETEYKLKLKNQHNNLEHTASILFVGYKNFISSQDSHSCVFYPSCSVYAVQCIKSDPFPKSIFKIFDRLTRCHPLASNKYYENHESGLLYDPVETSSISNK